MNGLESLIAIIQALLILSEHQYLGGSASKIGGK